MALMQKLCYHLAVIGRLMMNALNTHLFDTRVGEMCRRGRGPLQGQLGLQGGVRFRSRSGRAVLACP